MLRRTPMAAMAGMATDGIGIRGLTRTPLCRGTEFSSARLGGAFIRRGARSGRRSGVLADMDSDMVDIIPCITRTALVLIRGTGVPVNIMGIPQTMGMECTTQHGPKVA